ncbi:MAG TPA: tetratricopeptide repeat protein [Planctomycetota bacterium]
MIDGSLALRLRDAVREDVELRFGRLCVSRGILSEDDLRRGMEERKRLGDASLVHALLRLAGTDGGTLWPLLDEVLSSPADAPPGRRLGRYELIREIGKGGTGTVYKAYDTRLNRVVAVKTLQAADPEELVREARTLAELSHKNIVAVYDAGEIDGTPFLCMEHVEGSPLSPSTPHVPRMLQKVAEAVAYAHARGIVHRDLKPGNILVDRDGEPRVIDFGLARVRGRAGTPAYMAPEQVNGEGAGPAADVYALGVCLYEALTGARPFEGTSTSDIFQRVLARKFEAPRARRPDVPRALERICLKAMEADPARRYAGAAELARDLDRALAGRPRFRWTWAALAAAAAIAAAAWVVDVRRPDPRLKPLEELIFETRPFFYIKDADVAGRMSKVRAALADLEGLPAWRTLGMGHYFAGDLKRAEEALTRAPEDGAVHFYLGRLYLDRAIVELLTPPGRPEAERRERSKAWNEKAAVHLRKASTWEGAPELDRRLADAGLAFAKGDAAEAVRLCAEGVERFAGKLGVEEFSRLLGVLAPPAERAAHLTRAIEFRPHYPWARLQRGSQLLLEGKPDAAIEDFDKALALAPGLVYAWNDRGVARFAKGEFAAALADFDRALALDPDNGAAWGNRALARGSLKDLKGAIEDGTRAIALAPFPAPLLLNRGFHRLASGDLDGALADLEDGLAREPLASRGYALRGEVRSRKKLWAEAAADFEKALALDPANAEARAGRGIARLNLDDRGGARRDLDEALRARPALADAWFHRGSMRAEEGDVEGAIDDLTEALRHEPAHQAARVSRGIAWESAGDFEKAIADYDQALRDDPRSYDALLNRGLARLELGKAQAAAADVREALRLAPADWNSRALAESTLKSLSE